MAFRIVEMETTRESRDVDVPLIILCNIVQAVALEGRMQLRLTRQRIVGIEVIVCT